MLTSNREQRIRNLEDRIATMAPTPAPDTGDTSRLFSALGNGGAIPKKDLALAKELQAIVIEYADALVALGLEVDGEQGEADAQHYVQAVAAYPLDG